MAASVAVIVLLVVATAVVRHFSSPRYIEKRLAEAVGPGYHVSVGSSHYHPFQQVFHATDVSVVSDTLRPVPPALRDRPHTSSAFRAPVLRASGVNLWALSRGNIDIDRIEFDRPEAWIYTDRRGTIHHLGDVRRMPHEVLMSWKTRIRIDTIRIINGDIRYSERARDGDRRGTFRFAHTYATITDLANTPAQIDHPCVIDVRTRLVNSGLLHATFEYDLSSRPLRLNYHATMGKMDATALNALLVNLKGIKIREGAIDSTSFNFKVTGDVATGTMTLLYHGLEFEVLDKNSHDKSIGNRLATLMQNHKTHSSNPEDDDEPATVVTLQRRREPRISFVKFVWENVRDGALRTVGVL